ncbi:hypothetical protein C3747_40g242 [Trypanosoma cruzi]|uniref:Uncharacterized protein n=1 Tax=Trypanosoma cruzi TaxID=5693 RepID=A0A2V2WZ39_TRYCR|nr:hypothetical protein C3747_40g242 [Trypanosoma cruzi]RNC59558.1 hypothetical protein TcCL_ESM02761 [Trypanosoma cruzi]
MRLGSPAHLRRFFPAEGMAAAITCCLSPRCLASSRQIHGRSGRGDLFFVNSDARRHDMRALVQLRGPRQSSQATCPESGQLYYKKLMLHAVSEGANSGSEQYRHAASTWAYLLPSLLRCAELAVAETLWAKLCRIELEGNKGEGTLLTEREKKSLRDGQELFRYELHQRIPLLEESVTSAGLRELISWFTVARRSWVRLPTTSSSPKTPSIDIATNHLVSMEGSLLPSRDIFSVFAAPNVFRDTTPGSCQTYNMAMRVARLTEVVVLSVHDEMARLGNDESIGKDKPKSARLLEKEEKMRQCLLDEFRWHNISYRAVVSNNAAERGERGGAKPSPIHALE